jgi:hypothetical protein
MVRKLKDPVEKQADINAEEEEFASLDVSKIKVEVLPESAAKALRPFDGYPVKKVKIPVKKYGKNDHQVKGADGKAVIEAKEFNMTEWVLHNSLADPVHQDPSNRRHRTYHSRSILNILQGNSAANTTVQFATLIETGSGKFYGALVPDPYIRCQFIFQRDKKSGRVQIDKRYMLLDPDQKNRLKQCYFQLIQPQLDMEAAADKITAGEEPASMREVAPGDEL